MILDSSVLIADERRRFALPSLFADFSGESFHVAAITISELWHGAERAAATPRRQAREKHLRQQLAYLNVLSFDAAVARDHATIWADLELKGTLIGAHDLQIAATAIHHRHALATLNEKEFSRVPGLRLINVTPYLQG